jgi:outer membrane receptor protein involved in Fe transport
VVGNELPRRPQQQLYARAAIQPGPLEAHLEVRHVGLQYTDRYNLPGNVVPAATTLGAGASVRLHRTPQVSLHLQVDNLTDRRDLLDGFGNPLPGRSVMLTLRAGGSEPAWP